MSNVEPIRRKGIKLGSPRQAGDEEIFVDDSGIIEENFPTHRTLHLIPEDGIFQTSERVEIVVTEEVLLSTSNHVAQDMTKESGGFLLGNHYECPNTNRSYIVIDQFMQAEYTEGTQVSLTFTTDSWAQLKDRLDGKYRGKQLVGWYHSHPGMGIFLSNYDLDIHRNRFSSEWDVALVLDPIKHEGGFFGWVEGNINPHERLDFYELLEGDSRDSVVAWTNYSPEDPKTKSLAALKEINTKNYSGKVSGNGQGSQKTPVTSQKSLLNNPLLIIGASAVLLVFLLGAVIAGYYFLFSNKTTTKDNSGNNQNEEVVNNKFLNGERIIVKNNMVGHVSPKDQKIKIDLNITGIGDPQILEEINRDKKVSVTINSQTAEITESNPVNGSILKLRAESPISEENLQAFNDNKVQDFKMTVDISYNGDLVSKTVETKFKKASGSDSLGTKVVFDPTIRERNEKVTRKPSTTKPNESNNPKTPQTKQTTPSKNSDSSKSTKSSDKNSGSSSSTTNSGGKKKVEQEKTEPQPKKSAEKEDPNKTKRPVRQDEDTSSQNKPPKKDDRNVLTKAKDWLLGKDGKKKTNKFQFTK